MNSAPKYPASNEGLSVAEERVTLPEIFALLASLIMAILKMLFVLMTVMILIIAPEEAEAELAKHVGGQHVYCVVIYNVLSIVTTLNTLIMVNCRKNETFLEDPSNLSTYNVNSSFGLILQMMVYLLYVFDMPNDFSTLKLYGDIIRVLVMGDLVTCVAMYILEWKVNYTRRHNARLPGPSLDESDRANLLNVG